MSLKVLSVTQVNEYVRATLDADPLLNAVAVKGEISNYKLYPSGHHYFTLKDDNAALKCVMFRNYAMRLRFRPENGMKVIAAGNISVYARDGAYQLYCNTIIPDGVGDLHIAFEQLKAKLSAEGLFDPEHKKPIPKYPATIGIITSSAGAAIHDMLRILSKRYPLCNVKLLPVRVQGDEAPGEIAAAIGYANHHKLADLLIVGRGGGSIEDLWAFNDEIVARAIYASEIPIISAVGHEPDVTISDYVADLRAATPSNAAELAVPDQNALRQRFDETATRMTNVLINRVSALRNRLEAISATPALQSANQYANQRRQALLQMDSRLRSACNLMVSNEKRRFVSLAAKMDAMSPLKVLSRGYAVARSSKGNVIRSINHVAVNDNIDVLFHDGVISAKISERRNHPYE